MQAQFMAWIASPRASAPSGTIFENRSCIAGADRLGAEINIEGNTAVVTGVEP